MRTYFLALLAIVGVPAGLGAAELWQTKPVREWTREETERFLRDSPWVREVRVGGSLMALGRPVATATAAEGLGGSSRGQRGGEPSSLDVDSEEQQGVPYYIQWTSARIVRHAGSHFQALQSGAKEETEPAALDMHILTVGGPDLKAFEGVTDAELKAAAYLRPRRSQARVEPAQVRVQRQQDGRIISVHFGFPRALGGQPMISDEEKSVEFFCKSKDLKLKTSFNLSKMTTQQGRDL